MDNKDYWQQIHSKGDELNSLLTNYWNQYSDFGTWQFWMVLLLLIAPIILLYFTVDRKRIFELFFFGYTVNMLWTLSDIALGRSGLFVHKYFLIPSLPISTNITASVLPVAFLWLYQYCTSRKNNFYLYTLILSAVFAFGFASLEKYLGLVEFRNGMNQFHLFLFDVGIIFLSYWFTKLILKLRVES
ncbi:hypothetical protein [Cytobacillus purgationiresistens]|uniref:Uncharacterized protein n=1 Tax=Cytobacillus purgationiresistens TaxID=863449 RepID=A0ABU0AIV2_9BACI|nr:hypothetical protein [Cytobacillus purgationiresistens]MDQ0270960.1 hypothetical protein [Cytobacillus purgationiresistens]